MVVAYEILVSPQGPFGFGFLGFGAKGLGPGLDNNYWSFLVLFLLGTGGSLEVRSRIKTKVPVESGFSILSMCPHRYRLCRPVTPRVKRVSCPNLVPINSNAKSVPNRQVDKFSLRKDQMQVSHVDKDRPTLFIKSRTYLMPGA